MASSRGSSGPTSDMMSSSSCSRRSFSVRTVSMTDSSAVRSDGSDSRSRYQMSIKSGIGTCRVAIVFRKVDLPEPFCPISP